MDNPLISVIIPTFNRAKMVCNCVRSVLDSVGVDFEVIVVDDCSKEDVAATLKNAVGADARLHCLRNEKNLQLGKSRTRGAKGAKGELLLFLDDDNIVDREMLKNLADEFVQHLDTGLAAPMAVHVNGPKDGTIWTLGSDFNRWTSQPNDHLAGIPFAELPTDQTRFPTLYCPNAFMVRKAVFEQIGGFDFNLPFNYDDADLGWRIHDLGYKNWILSTARTRHMNFMTDEDTMQLRQLGLNAPWKAYTLSRNRLHFVRKHFSFLQILSVTFIFAPLSAAYYCTIALRNRRPDIAWAYLKGTIKGTFGF